MADAKITITADAQEAKATLEELRGIAGEVFTGVKVDAEKAAQAQEMLAQEWQKVGVTTSQAKKAAQQLKPVMADLGKTSGGTGDLIKGLRGEMFGLYSTTQLVTANLRDLQAGLAPLVDVMKQAAVETGATQQAVDLFSNSVEMLIKPTTIAKNLIENFKIAWDVFRDSISTATEEQKRFAEQTERVEGILETYRQKVAENQQAIEDRTRAMSIQVGVEERAGGVTAETRAEVEKLVAEYDKYGKKIPAALDLVRIQLGITTKAQDEAAEAAKRAGEEAAKAAEKQVEAAEKARKAQLDAAEKHAAKLADETAALGAQFSSTEKLIPALTAIAEGKKVATAAADDSIRALKEELDLMKQQADEAQKQADAAQQKAGDAAKRIAELEGSPVLTIDEQNELNDLKDQQVQIDQEAADAAENAAQAAFEYGDAQDALAQSTTDATGALDDQAKSGDVVADLWAKVDAATAAYTATLADVGDQAQSTTAYVEAIGKNGQKFWTNFTDTIVDSGRALDGTADAAGQIPDELSKIGPAAERAGEGLAGLDEALAGDGEGGFAKTAQDIDSVNTGLERTHELARLIRLEFQRINTAIGGASE